MTDQDALVRLSRPTAISEFTRLRRRITTHMAALEEQQWDHEQLDVVLAVKIADVLNQLIAEANVLDAEGRAVLRGGIEYFLLTTDSDDDVRSPVGLRDDARVVNLVLDALRRPELAIELPNT